MHPPYPPPKSATDARNYASIIRQGLVLRSLYAPGPFTPVVPFRNVDADPRLVLEFVVFCHRLLWLVYCLVAGYFLARYSAKFADFCILSLAFLLGKVP